jgi:hypothetical protein
VQQNKFVLAEVAVRFWNTRNCRFDNFWVWSIFPMYTGKSMQIQPLGFGPSLNSTQWQPRLSTPFICQFVNCQKGIIAKTPFSTSHQFGTFSSRRKLRWASTPERIRMALRSKTFYNRVGLWETIQHLSSNSLRRFHMEKGIRSNAIGLQGCYFIRRLANNLGEPQ